MKKKIGVLGAGTWGAALSAALAKAGHAVVLYSALPAEIEFFKKEGRHPKLAAFQFPAGIVFTDSIQQACTEKDLLLFSVPSPYVRATAMAARPFVSKGQLIADVAKGIEEGTLLFMSEVIKDVLEDASVVALTGPTHAEEVAADMPTTIVSAASDLSAAEAVQEIFINTCLRVYTNPDIRGAELSGAMKNVIALATGIADGIGYGDNAKAALITRGMAEITRLGLAIGCDARTFSGLAGIGDLIVTATSPHSRNGKAGKLIGQGYSAKDAIAKVGMVVEGLNALPAAMALSEKHGVELPITRAVHAVVNENVPPQVCVEALMTRTRKNEF